ncbi:MAG: aminotransferase class I/II-fold pyridoxal phosphate-dependent enzyme [Acidobacteria bacterium]|nr:aminotransferase class I/II-fold pyridoxal phosphate-dependent enzyme [Acidobacteriota bacterium]
MSLTRRRLFQRLAAVNAAPVSGEWVSARGREAAVAEGRTARGQMAASAGTNVIRIASNENPLGPGQRVLDVIVGKFPEAGRYPFNAQQQEPELVKAIAGKQGVKVENITLGAGSGEILTNAVRAFTSTSKPLATPWPTFEAPRDTAQKVGTPVRAIALDGQLRVDIDKLVEAATGAGLVFFCNPNNPTATVHGAPAVADFVKRVRAASPDTVILIDEAYHDYVTDPAYQSAMELAKSTPKVFVARTFSKAYGMAGMRVGYGVGDPAVIKELNRYRMPYSISLPAIAASVAALHDQAHIDAERQRNTDVKAFTVRAFEQMGVKATDSQANFLFLNLQRPAAAFRDACRAAGVMVGRDFPPYEKTHCRVSIGTMDEMERAVAVFKKVLGSNTTTAAGRRGQ